MRVRCLVERGLAVLQQHVLQRLSVHALVLHHHVHHPPAHPPTLHSAQHSAATAGYKGLKHGARVPGGRGGRVLVAASGVEEGGVDAAAVLHLHLGGRQGGQHLQLGERRHVATATKQEERVNNRVLPSGQRVRGWG